MQQVWNLRDDIHRREGISSFMEEYRCGALDDRCSDAACVEGLYLLCDQTRGESCERITGAAHREAGVTSFDSSAGFFRTANEVGWALEEDRHAPRVRDRTDQVFSLIESFLFEHLPLHAREFANVWSSDGCLSGERFECPEL